MTSLLLLIALSAGADPAGTTPAPAEARAAAERSLPYLMKSSAAWREDRKCVTCHQVPFALWPLNDARTRGIRVDEKFTDDLTAWSLNFCTTNKNDNEFTGGFLSTMVKLILALEGSTKKEDVAKAYEFFVPIIAKRQRPDGSWKEGNFIEIRGARREGIETDTMWTLIGLNALEKQAGEVLTPLARDSIKKMRELGLASLKDATPETRTDWLALRMLVEHQNGDPKQAEKWRKELLKRQNADGGWPFVKDGASHPLVTGECLYLLSVGGLKGDEPEVRRAWKFLVSAQEKDGSWKTTSRQEFGKSGKTKINDVNTHWGTGWAAVGLLRTLPGKP
ncbi:prenyltransferase/squalene oxidase repeat-containing protein [Zavarzinella formosa]|uniref:prenyltransferase/squalene oxidase repeat-containing protein n=1 Tax=Zavarzinella formosa TaxID=360055 RepID=UPI0002E297BB|nr:prenyltransferase/squalene oxidase repeat-containing protein [Zavarzinella formosa]